MSVHQWSDRASPVMAALLSRRAERMFFIAAALCLVAFVLIGLWRT
jgi:hypothetical protein